MDRSGVQSLFRPSDGRSHKYIYSLLIESIDSDSDEPDDEPPATIDRLRKRRSHIPKETQQPDRTEKHIIRKARQTLSSSAVGIPVLYPATRADITCEI